MMSKVYTVHNSYFAYIVVHICWHVCFPQKLSDEEHFVEGTEHNPDYDHEAFLGEDAKEFDELTPEESKERLA